MVKLLQGGDILAGIIFSIIAGICMSLQGVFNTRTGEKIGNWETNMVVQGSGFLITLIIVLIMGNGNLKKINEVNKLYLTGGALGVVIIYTVMIGIKSLGATYSISTILVSQLVAAALIDRFALFDTKPMEFGMSKIIGVVIMIAGIIIFKKP